MDGRDNYEDDDSMAFMNAMQARPDVEISGRDDYEEKHWWDPAMRSKQARPGPGMISTMLADELHDPGHSLFSVLVNNPNIKPPAFSSTDPSSAQLDRNDLLVKLLNPPLPTDNEVRTAVPHPDAYYCPEDNGWVILSWKFSSVSPPYAKSFEESRHQPLPDQERRRRYVSCLNDVHNKTHHFHKYEKAVDSHKLTPPLQMEEWEITESVKQKRRVGIIDEDLDVEQLDPKEFDMIDETDYDAEEGRLLDLYICCQCSLYCVASGVIPGVIPRKCFDEFIRDKGANPPVGLSGEVAIYVAFETILRIIENKLWKGENRLLRTDPQQFQIKLGWSQNTKRTMETLGFNEEIYENRPALRCPPTDLASPIGRMNRRKLLRAWVEVNAWLVDFRQTNATHFKDLPERKVLSVQIESAKEMYQTAIGAHPDQIPRGELSADVLQASQFQVHDWKDLGLTPTSFSADLLAFAYYAQARCDPARTIEHFTSFYNIVTMMQNFADSPQTLPEILATERWRDRFTTEDVQQAATVLGFGENGVLGMRYNKGDVPEQFLENAWRDCMKRSWREPGGSVEMQRISNEAFRVLAEARGSEALRRVWENAKNGVMTPEKAYDTLEVPKDMG